MFEELQRCIADLENARAGWVTRKDAAEHLAVYARDALACLQSHAEDPDKDVGRTVQEALETLGEPAKKSAKSYTMEELLQACVKPPKRTLEHKGDQDNIQVQLAGERSQTVHVKAHSRSDGIELIRIYTYCGEATQKVMEWALKGNTKLPHCASAMHRRDDKDWMILVFNLERRGATPKELKTAVKAIAYYGDWFEKKLTGLDAF